MRHGSSKHRELLTHWQSTLMRGRFSVTGICRMTNLLGLWPDVSYLRRKLVSPASVSRSVRNKQPRSFHGSFVVDEPCVFRSAASHDRKHVTYLAWYVIPESRRPPQDNCWAPSVSLKQDILRYMSFAPLARGTPTRTPLVRSSVVWDFEQSVAVCLY
jgi:hypothetical protein